MGKSSFNNCLMRFTFVCALITTLLAGVFIPIPAYAAPVVPGSISVTVSPEQFVPAQAGYVFVSGGYPLEVTITLDGQPLEVFWSGEGYMAYIAFGFDAAPGDH